MKENYTEGAQRAIDRAEIRARLRGSNHVEPADLLASLVDEEETRAAEILGEFGLLPERVRQALGINALPEGDDTIALVEDPIPHSSEFRSTLSDAEFQARMYDRARLVGTEHLLAGLIGSSGPASELLAQAGIALAKIAERINEQVTVDTTPIPLAIEFGPLDLGDSLPAADLGRILDASANRAREGLRVVEDYVRFVLDDPALTKRLKEVRHRLTQACKGFDPDWLIGARDTAGDVGTHIMTPSEQVRENPRAVLTANFKRTTEALRPLEEYSKLVDSWVSGRFEVLRYDLYTLEKLTLAAAAAHRSLGDSKLMVLIGGLRTLGDLTWVVGEALEGGADVIQLREKGIPDREWLTRAREVRIVTAKAKAKFVVNDRPDLARLAGADALHLGQDDVALRDARRIVGHAMTIGLSTHNRSQLEAAILAGAGYLGVGPMFNSQTKDFDEYAGLAFAQAASETTSLPWFAIGGVNEENLDQLLEAGARRIAVSAAVVKADSPRKAAANLRARLDAIAT